MHVPSAAINSAGSNKGAGFHFHEENHGKQLQIVKSQNNQILRFAIVFRDFLRENEIPRLYYCPRNSWQHWVRLFSDERTKIGAISIAQKGANYYVSGLFSVLIRMALSLQNGFQSLLKQPNIQ